MLLARTFDIADPDIHVDALFFMSGNRLRIGDSRSDFRLEPVPAPAIGCRKVQNTLDRLRAGETQFDRVLVFREFHRSIGIVLNADQEDVIFVVDRTQIKDDRTRVDRELRTSISVLRPRLPLINDVLSLSSVRSDRRDESKVEREKKAQNQQHSSGHIASLMCAAILTNYLAL